VTGREIGTLTTRMDRAGVSPSDSKASTEGDVRNQRRSCFIVIPLMARQRAAFPNHATSAARRKGRNGDCRRLDSRLWHYARRHN